jgi:hypothetical protein
MIDVQKIDLELLLQRMDYQLKAMELHVRRVGRLLQNVIIEKQAAGQELTEDEREFLEDDLAGRACDRLASPCG